MQKKYHQRSLSNRIYVLRHSNNTKLFSRIYHHWFKLLKDPFPYLVSMTFLRLFN